MRKINQQNYEGKSVFVGIDVHKKNYVITAICDNEVVKKWTTIASPDSLALQLKRYFNSAKIHCAYEAGFSGFKLHRTLEESGISNLVVNPASIEIEGNNRVKTDKRDSRKIAEQLAANRLRSIYIPTAEEEDRRSLSRGREQTVERRKSIGNQLKMKLHYLGIEIPENKRVSEKFLRWVETLDTLPGHKFYLSELIDAWRAESLRIKRFDNVLKRQAEEDEAEKIYRSVPGIGAYSSRVLSNELGDMSRFDNERQLSSASGLTPCEYSSGDHVRKGNISRQGPARIRNIMVEVAWRAATSDLSLKECYERISRARGGKKAIVAVARKMLLRIRRCLKEKVIWRDLSLQSCI